MHKNLLAYLTLIFIAYCTLATAEEKQHDDIDITKNYFGFGSVENAINELSLAHGAQTRKTNDRTVISIEAERVKWEFPSKSQAYYPSIIKSQVILKGGEIDYQVNISCGAEKNKCDEMSKSYAAHVKAIKKQFSK